MALARLVRTVPSRRAPAGFLADTVREKRYPTAFSKEKKKGRDHIQMQNSKWTDLNSPKLLVKNLRMAESYAARYGDVERIQQFDLASAAFPNPVPLIACTMLERSNVVMRELEDWEEEFLEFQEKRNEPYDKHYLQEYVDRCLASTRAKETAKDEDGSTSATKTSALEEFFQTDGLNEEEDDRLDVTDFKPASRTTEADKLNDVRSLDRALSLRLALLVRRKSDGVWTLPGGPRQEGERMVDAAARHMRAIYGPKLREWYPGNAPMGYMLNVYSPEVQAAKACYGEKIFYYRAEIFGGRISLSEDYDDYMWLSRDEIRDFFKEKGDPDYAAHLWTLIGGGAGEENVRRAKSLKAKIEAGTVKPSVLHRLKTLEEKRRQRELQLALEL